MVDASGNVDPNMPADDINLTTDGTVARATENAIIGGNLSADGIPIDNPAATPPVDGTFTNTMGLYDSLVLYIPLKLLLLGLATTLGLGQSPIRLQALGQRTLTLTQKANIVPAQLQPRFPFQVVRVPMPLV